MDNSEIHVGNILSLLTRSDGSVKADMLRNVCQMPGFDQVKKGEPIIVALRYLTLRDAFRVFLDPPGNVGEGHFRSAENALLYARRYIEISRTPENGPIVAHALALLEKTLRDMEALRDVYRRIDALMAAEDPDAQLKQFMQQQINAALLETGERRDLYRDNFWFAWIAAWAMRLNGVGGGSIAELKSLYSQNDWLDRRLGGRRILRPPGGMIDPDEQEEEDFLLF
ncbi:MAG: hypothetical protein HQL88_03885 [Magnetococcales bacterium]|nr:hypothetical protein [Magnetococcales bacterium]